MKNTTYTLGDFHTGGVEHFKISNLTPKTLEMMQRYSRQLLGLEDNSDIEKTDIALAKMLDECHFELIGISGSNIWDKNTDIIWGYYEIPQFYRFD